MDKYLKFRYKLITVYIDVGTLNADNAILMFAFTGTNTGRNWDIRVSQIECTNPNR